MENQKSTPPQQTVIIINKPKSMGVAILLTIFFGPLGLLYASVAGGIVMIILSLIVGFVTLGLGLIVTWLVCIIWAAVAVSTSNSKQSSVGR